MGNSDNPSTESTQFKNALRRILTVKPEPSKPGQPAKKSHGPSRRVGRPKK